MGCATSSKGSKPAIPAANLFVTCEAQLRKRIVAGTQTGDRSDFKLVDANNPSTSSTVTADQADARLIQAVAIILAESGGFPEALCVNDASSSAPGSKDRGLWQLNSKANPTVTDAMAYDPDSSTNIAYLLSNGFLTWGPWAGSKGLDRASQPYKDAQAGYESAYGRAVPEIGLGPIAVTDPTSTLLDWAKGLGKLLSYVTSAAFWRRFGTGALGVLLVLIAVVLVVASSRTGKAIGAAAL